MKTYQLFPQLLIASLPIISQATFAQGTPESQIPGSAIPSREALPSTGEGNPIAIPDGVLPRGLAPVTQPAPIATLPIEEHAGTSVNKSADGLTETLVAFFNDCLNKPTHLAPPDSRHNNFFSKNSDVSLRVKASGARPGAKVWLKAEVGPTGFSTVPEQNQVFERSIRADNKGEFEIRISMNIAKWRKFKDPSVIAAKVIWAERDVKAALGGGGSASIATPRKNVAYRIKDGALCYWQTPAAVASEYIINHSSGSNMLISRQEELQFLKAHRFGVGIGFGNYFEINHRGQGPYGPTLSGSSSDYINTLPGPWPVEIWLIINWTSTTASRTKASIKQSWTLLPLDGGFFGQRFTVARYAAEEYVPNEKSSCGEWKLNRTGILDTGISSTTLYSVPNYLQGKPDEAREFMDRIYPPLNTCDADPQDRKFKVKSPEGDFLFFYPN